MKQAFALTLVACLIPLYALAQPPGTTPRWTDFCPPAYLDAQVGRVHPVNHLTRSYKRHLTDVERNVWAKRRMSFEAAIRDCHGKPTCYEQVRQNELQLSRDFYRWLGDYRSNLELQRMTRGWQMPPQTSEESFDVPVQMLQQTWDQPKPRTGPVASRKSTPGVSDNTQLSWPAGQYGRGKLPAPGGG